MFNMQLFNVYQFFGFIVLSHIGLSEVLKKLEAKTT